MSTENTGRYNVSMPSWFHDRAKAHALSKCKTFAAYVRDLVSADMSAAGVDTAPPKRTRKAAKS